MTANNATGIVRYDENGVPQVGLEPWPVELRELAFDVWAFQCQRSAKDTAAYLNNIPNLVEEDHDHPNVIVEALKDRTIPTKTIANWASARRWEEKRADKMRELAPAMHSIVSDELRILSIEAIHQQKALLVSDETPAVVKAKIIDSILDRTGHQPFVRPKDDTKPRGPQPDYQGTVAGESLEQLQEILFGSFTVEPKE